jgi:phosphatidylinositol-3-phosphatase
MSKKAASLGLLLTALAGTLCAQEGPAPKGVPRLDHVFFIMMENHGYGQVLNNPNEPFVNQYAKSANLATNYFAVAHPSLTNYLEVNGGSNFGVLNDNSPDWHNAACVNNLTSGTASLDNGQFGNICPIYGTGTDAATPAVDFTNETSGPPGENNIDGVQSYSANPNTVGKTIADQLAERGLSWKSYQESLPLSGADKVDTSDGVFTDQTDFAMILPAQTPPLSQSDLVSLYAVKHDPFAYFRSVQEGENPHSNLKNIVAFDGARGLYADLGAGDVPTYSFIVPNQCNDQHGRGNAGAFCNSDPNDNGTQAGLNPALIYQGDVTVERIVRAIKRSPAWRDGRNAIVLTWDENDYSLAPNINQVVLIVDTNYGVHGVESGQRYTSFSLLKSLESAFRLPCLNHACDPGSKVMSDLFAGGNDRDHDHDGGW